MGRPLTLLSYLLLGVGLGICHGHICICALALRAMLRTSYGFSGLHRKTDPDRAGWQNEAHLSNGAVPATDSTEGRDARAFGTVLCVL